MTPPPLPDLQDQVLDEVALDSLFTDLAALADVRAIVYKGAREVADAHHAAPDLSAARRALTTGAVLGVQIRYLHAGREWWDTLLPVATGVRLVRIAHV